MRKRFKIGSLVYMKPAYVTWMLKNVPEVYLLPTETLADLTPAHESDMLLHVAIGLGAKVPGRIIAENEHGYLVVWAAGGLLSEQWMEKKHLEKIL